jgi:hypothetical protein
MEVSVIQLGDVERALLGDAATTVYAMGLLARVLGLDEETKLNEQGNFLRKLADEHFGSTRVRLPE